MNPLFSIIVPCYNSAETLERCINSILSQSCKSFELILVNDGSIDATRSILERYERYDNSIVVIHKANGGVSSARNVGLSQSRGEWITFVDSDDYVETDWLENFIIQISDDVELLIQGISFEQIGNLCVLSGSENKPIKMKTSDALNLMYKKNNLGYVFTKAFKKEILKSKGIMFETSLYYQEDEVFVLSYLSNISSCSYIGNVSYRYFVPNWSKYEKKKLSDLFRMKYEYVKKICNCDSPAYLSSLNDYVHNVFKDIYYCASYKDARKLCLDFYRSVGNDVKKTAVFFLTKMMMEVDKRAIFSPMFIKLHTLINRKVYR